MIRRGSRATFSTASVASGQLLLYPFFLAGVLDDPRLVQRDGLHPTAAGVDAIVAGVLPIAQELVARVRGRSGG
jgi:lysophospholipase L1-like esterase